VYGEGFGSCGAGVGGVSRPACGLALRAASLGGPRRPRARFAAARSRRGTGESGAAAARRGWCCALRRQPRAWPRTTCRWRMGYGNGSDNSNHAAADECSESTRRRRQYWICVDPKCRRWEWASNLECRCGATASKWVLRSHGQWERQGQTKAEGERGPKSADGESPVRKATLEQW
jgi:hypothetical protein